MWEQVAGQERAVATLQRAVHRPSHAYLLVGRRGSGVETAARCFAAQLVGPDDERAQRLVLRSLHPDVIEYEPDKTILSIEVVREVIKEVAAAPIESDRKVVILHVPAGPASAPAMNALLKTLEEPPAGRTIVIVTGAADDLPSTVRSRCQRVDLAPPGAPPAEYVGVRTAFAQVAREHDGTGASAVRLAAGLGEAIQDTIAAVQAAHARELEELDAQLEASGYTDRVAQRMRRRAGDLRKLRERSARRVAFMEGLAALEAEYRDALAGADGAIVAAPGGIVRALDACRAARRSFEFNPNEGLVLEWLVLRLPAAGRARRR